MGNAHAPPDTPESIGVTLPPIARHEFGGDAQLYLVEDHRVPLVSVAVLIQAGFADDPPGQEGLAALARALLSSEHETQPLGRYAELGTSLRSRISPTCLGLRCTVHRDDTLAALRLLIGEFQRIERSAESFERARREQVEILLANRGSPQHVGGYAIVLASLAIDPPAATMAWGTVRSLEALEPEDLWRWLDHYVRPRRLSFALAGALSLEEAFDWIDDAASSWAVPVGSGEGPPRAEVVRQDPSRHGVVLVPWPGNSEAILSFGTPTGDFGTSDVLDLAGAFVSGTIFDELREHQRAAYAVDSSGWFTRAGEIVQRWSAVAPDKVEPAIAGIRKRIEQWHDEPRYLRASVHASLSSRLIRYVEMMRRFESIDAILTQLLHMADTRLPVTTAERRLKELHELDADRLARVVLETYHPDRMRWSVVADPRVLESVHVHFRGQPTTPRRPGQLVGT